MIIKGAKRKPAAKPVVEETKVIKVEEPVAAPTKKPRKEKKVTPIEEIQPEITVEVVEVEETPIVEDEE